VGVAFGFVATPKELGKLSDRDRARWEARVRDFEDAEIDTELTPEQQDALRKSTNEIRARKGLPPLKPGWVETPPS
jgi:uncharacterized protein YkwD